jgi:hypothetical protein
MVEGRTTPSGKVLHKCNLCDAEMPNPTKWHYHRGNCLEVQLAAAKQKAEEAENLLNSILKVAANMGNESVCNFCLITWDNIKKGQVWDQRCQESTGKCSRDIRNYFAQLAAAAQAADQPETGEGDE